MSTGTWLVGLPCPPRLKITAVSRQNSMILLWILGLPSVVIVVGPI